VTFPPLMRARCIERPNRFLLLADLEGSRVRVACRDPGRLEGVLHPGVEIRIAEEPRPGRKTRYTLFLARVARGWACPVPALANRVFEAALADRELPGFRGARLLRREVRVDASRFDFLVSDRAGEILVEVKAVGHLVAGRGLFPDAPTARGLRHVRELTLRRRRGQRAAVVFIALRSGVQRVSPHATIDPALAEALADARRAGVLLRAYSCRVTTRGCRLERRVPVDLASLTPAETSP
jgi:sugar fermentation stimulation protein A